MFNQKQPNGRQAEPINRGMHLPSFKDLVAFSNGDRHADAHRSSQKSRRWDGIDAALPLQGDLDQPSVHVDVNRISYQHHRQNEPQAHRRPNLRARPEEQAAQDDGARYEVRIASHYPKGHAHTHSVQRVRTEGHRNNSIASGRRSCEVAEYEATQSQQNELLNSSHSGERVPISHPMKRTLDGHPHMASREVVREIIRSGGLNTSSSTARHFDEETRPLPTQPIPSQGSRVMPRSQHAFEMEMHHHQNEQNSVKTLGRAPKSNQVPSQQRPFLHMQPSPRFQPHPLDSPQKDSTFLSGQLRGAGMPSFHSQAIPPKALRSGDRGRKFDYSCARLPEERSLPSTSNSMRILPSARDSPQSRPGSSQATAASRMQESRGPRIPSCSEQAIEQRRHALQHHLTREDRQGYSAALGEERPAMLPFPLKDETKHCKDANGTPTHGSTSSTVLRQSSSTSLRSEARSSQAASSFRESHSQPRSSPALPLQHVLSSDQNASSDVVYVGQRSTAYGIRSERSYSTVQASPHAFVGQHEQSDPSRSSPEIVQQRVWPRQQLHRSDIEEGRLGCTISQHQFQTHDSYVQKVHSSVKDNAEEYRRNLHPEVQKQMAPRSESMILPSRSARGEDRRPMIAPAGSSRQKPRHDNERVYCIEPRIIFETLSPRTTVANATKSAQLSYQQRDQLSEEKKRMPAAQGRHQEIVQRFTNGQHHEDPSYKASSYRTEHAQPTRSSVDGPNTSPTAHQSVSGSVHRNDTTYRYLDRSCKGDDLHLVYHATQQLGQHDPQHRLYQGSIHREPPSAQISRLQLRQVSSSPHHNKPSNAPHFQHPVLDSQHSQSSSTFMSAPSRPLKRARAGSDTSLVLKTSRCAVEMDALASTHLVSTKKESQTQFLEEKHRQVLERSARSDREATEGFSEASKLVEGKNNGG
ncbi:uncharacterized protein MEPE_01380 [Melanopsichium pennsylvanicum]|uniref:Uncharacterized protein n=2 Tax=Melanopsichium pennsylvanicum TaxID=63383 RepID=A0AAJ4XHI7_9BASI|nr:uncharacterized protein BN887_03955 [Melanopsichium pennsylvanicum 4]SNX82674.1 uncharacterized protein MEPE_01380 [Melanopsichium pennsylvanicum]